MFGFRSILILLLIGVCPFTFSQDTLQTTESWRGYNEYFVLHGDSTFEYNVKRHHYFQFYGVGSYTYNDKQFIFKFDSTLFQNSTYSCTQELSDSIQLKVISTLTNSGITNYSYATNGVKNINGWNGSEAITGDIDSVVIAHQQYQSITIYPKHDSCNCYWITFGFENYHMGNAFLILEGEIRFKRKKFKKKNLYKRQYDAETDLVYKKIKEQRAKDIIGIYEEPFILKKH